MIAENLKYLRTKNNFSQQTLSETLGIPRTTLGDYERGKTEPNISMMLRMARLFDVTVDELISKEKWTIRKAIEALLNGNSASLHWWHPQHRQMNGPSLQAARPAG